MKRISPTQLDFGHLSELDRRDPGTNGKGVPLAQFFPKTCEIVVYIWAPTNAYEE
jgi:hypothetical protein